MASTVKSGWVYALTTTAIAVVLLALPYICYHKELALLNDRWWFVAIQVILISGTAACLVGVFRGKDDDNGNNFNKVMACLFALAFAITGLASGASQRSNADQHLTPQTMSQ